MLVNANALHIPLPDQSVHCCITSPPYWGLRDYGLDDGLGLEPTIDEHIDNMVQVFREVWRVLRDDGTLWLNYGDSYAGAPAGNKGEQRIGNGGQILASKPFDSSKRAGLKPKNLIGMPWRVAFALQADGWYLRSDIIWHKPNPMPEPVTDRPTKSHEYVFLLTKRARYFYDQDAIKEPLTLPDAADGSRIFGGRNKRGANVAHARTTGRAYTSAPSGRNKRTVWTIPTFGYPAAHFATFPPKLVEPMVMAGCPIGGLVFDPFVGSGTTIQVARALDRRGIGLDLSAEYLQLARQRLQLDKLDSWGQGIKDEQVYDDLPLFGNESNNAS